MMPPPLAADDVSPLALRNDVASLRAAMMRCLPSCPAGHIMRASAHHCRIIPFLQELFKEAIIRIPKENRPLIENMFYKIESEYNGKRENKDIFLKLYISELILYLHRYRILNAHDEFSNDKVIQKIKQYIDINFESEISLNELSHTFGLTESYLSKRFKSVIGTGINEYINYVRIEHAVRLLKQKKLPITEVATRCGFNNSSYFAAVFKKLKGVTPYRFAKNSVDK